MQRTTSFLLLVCLVNLAVGQSTWRKAFGAFGDEQARVVRTTPDGMMIVAGTTGSFGGGSSDVYLLKIDAEGELVWSRTIGGPDIEQARSLAVLPDGGFVIGGVTNANGAQGYDGMLIRTDADGVPIWQRNYGGADWNFINQVVSLDGGNLLAAGQTFTASYSGQAWFLLIDAAGDTLATRSFGGLGEEAANDAIGTDDGGFALAGYSVRSNGLKECYLVRILADLDTAWTAHFGGDTTSCATGVLGTNDGAFSVIGSTNNFSTDWTEHYHAKVSADGDVLWEKNWGQINDQEAYEHVQLLSGTFITTGYTKTSGGGEKDMFVLLSNENGDFMEQHTFGGGGDDIGYSIDTAADGFVVAGLTRSYGAGGDDVFVVRTDMNGNTATEVVGDHFDPLSVATLEGTNSLRVHPNPCVDQLFLSDDHAWKEVVLFAAEGMRVKEWSRPVRALDVRGLPDGYYLLTATTADGSRVASPVIIRTK